MKLSEWRLKISETGSNALAKLNAAADKTSAKFGNLQKKLDLSSNQLSNFGSQIPGLNNGLSMISSKAGLAGAAIAGMGYVLYKSGKLAYDFDQGMAKINSTAQLTAPELAKLRTQLKAIGTESGGNFERIPDAFEKINSQVNDVNKSMAILNVANKVAKAGFVDIDLAASAVAQTMSITGNGVTADNIADVLLKSKALGAGEFQDFAQYLPMLTAAGTNLSIGFKDTAGLFAYMTAKGQNAADAAMLIQNAFTALGKNEIIAKMKAGGLNIFNKDGSIRAMDAVFKDLSDKVKKMSAQQKSQFLESIGLRDAQAKNAFAILASDAEKLKTIMDGVRDSTGELNIQLDKTANRSRMWGDIGDAIKGWAVTIGDKLLPILDKIGGLLDQFARTANGKADWQQTAKLQADEKLSNQYAARELYKKYPFVNTEEKGKYLDPKLKSEYMTLFNTMYAKLTGAFGGDYKKFVKDQQTSNKEKADKTASGKSSAELKSGIDAINGGGKQVRNVTVNFNKAFVEKFMIQPQTLKESSQEVIAQVEEWLLRAINGAELSLTNE